MASKVQDVPIYYRQKANNPPRLEKETLLVQAERRLALQRKSTEEAKAMEEKAKAFNEILVEELEAIRKLQAAEADYLKTTRELKELMIKTVHAQDCEELRNQISLLKSSQKDSKVMEVQLKEELASKVTIESIFAGYRAQANNIIHSKTTENESLQKEVQQLKAQNAFLASSRDESEKSVKLMEERLKKEVESKSTIETELEVLRHGAENIIQLKETENQLLFEQLEELKAELSAQKAKRPNKLVRFFRRLFRRH